MTVKPKSVAEIEIMREGGRRLATILDKLAAMVEPGLRPTDISAVARAEIKKASLKPVVLGYEGFPDVMCISVNEVIVHGIPQKKPLGRGDIVKLDLTVGYKSLIVDSAVSVIAGKAASAESKRLVDGTRAALQAGISAISGDGTRVGDISQAVQDELKKYKLGVIRDLVGHGIGHHIHEDPNIPNYGLAGTGPLLSAGMTIAIEPMASLGDWHVNILKDGTAVMSDGSLGAHFEHTVLITNDGAEILTTT
ncbi:type I methionyl aminopeptidase [Candidatus Saccharibacteria bacterium RIFCSPHIGHO2_12_FULL_49_19]|nr:MAG: type I methionyl aminopeptidase [Candidatus Saccharibacteria bacterium RIFCSPHIGHO2_01_FULL_49_21]OGL36589.1 MAG: type I methionyl aminopeptidase [Candidatus Saccharibacteria bacterium RIFCSPHIGHO2_12_FULL_49_19]OGL37856.1 MAG: type I methionyl aminopeptidase [Candidatus Saccharibacteria bacterium RIFCSPLOWO2_01_FULL_49_22]